MSLKTLCEVVRVRRKRLRYRLQSAILGLHAFSSAELNTMSDIFVCSCPQEAEAFALYHKALDLQKHDKFEESAKAYHELLKTPLLKEVEDHTAYSPVEVV